MNIINNKYVYIVIGLMVISDSYSISLENLKVASSYKTQNPIFSWVYKKHGYSPYFYLPYTENKFFTLSGSGKGIGSYDKKSTKSPVGWGISRWPQELKNKDVADMYQIFSDPDFAQDYSYSPYQSTNPNFKQPPVRGCLSEIPLRYGDVDNNKTDELMLLLGHKDQVLDFVLFNPDQEKISFSARVIMSDIDDYHGTDSQYQYTSNFNMSKGEYAGTQTFAKVFMGEFDGFESSKDIIVWRKHYKTLKHSASDKGFKLESQNYQFYTLKDGEYKLQISLEAQIEQWMSANNLTWQSGFPSKSECAGQ
jgi:hypothetical protein